VKKVVVNKTRENTKSAFIEAPASATRKLICIAHRGASGHEPENTLRAIRRALEFGADGIEIDVYFVDGELVVFHDAKLDRTTNGRGRLMKKKFEQLRALDAGKGERIPTLREVLDTVDGRAFINIEMKGRRTAKPVLELIRGQMRARGLRREDFLISSFWRRELRDLRALGGSEIPLGILFARRARRFKKLAAQLGASAIHTPLNFTNARLVRRAHENNLKVFVYTANDPRDIERMRKIGVDGVFTDFPKRVNSRAANNATNANLRA